MAVKKDHRLGLFVLLGGLALGPVAHAINDETFVSLPRYVRIPKIVYPEAMRQQEVEGLVIVRVLIGLDGKASEVRIFKSSGWVDLDNGALQAVRGAQWETVSEPIWCKVPVMFRLR